MPSGTPRPTPTINGGDGKLDGCRKHRQQVGDDGLAGRRRNPKIAGQHVLHIAEELHPDGLVEAEFEKHAVIDRLADLRPGDGEHRIGRQQAAHREGQRQQAEQRRHDGREAAEHGAGLPPEGAVQWLALRRAIHCRRACARSWCGVEHVYSFVTSRQRVDQVVCPA